MINHQWRRLGVALPKAFCWLLTFLSVVVAWVFFRADNISQAMHILVTMTDFQNIFVAADNWNVDKNAKNVYLSILGLGALLCLPNPVVLIERFRANWLWYVMILTMFLVALYQMNTYTEFLYFQF